MANRDHLFKPGQSGNPAGKPKGSRNKLTEDFLRDLHESWKERGRQALAEASADVYVRVVASLVPKQLEVTRPLAELSDDDLALAVEHLRASIAERAGSGDNAAPVGQPAEGVPTLQ